MCILRKIDARKTTVTKPSPTKYSTSKQNHKNVVLTLCWFGRLELDIYWVSSSYDKNILEICMIAVCAEAICI